MKMFDAQKLLGQVLREAASGGLGGSRRNKRRAGSLTGLPRGVEAKVGMGLLGLAIAAYEHFRQPAAASGQTPANVADAASPLAASTGPTLPPPPPPGRPAPALAGSQGDRDQLRSLHLLRAMIAAAHADARVDDGERLKLMEHAREAGVAGEDLDALDREIRNPLSLEQLVLQTPAGLNEEVYVAALIAIDIDDASEHQFMATLAAGLGLDAPSRARIEAQLGIHSPTT